MTYADLIYETTGHIAIVTLNRPEKLNALSLNLHQEVVAAMQEARNNDEVRAVVLTGAGRGFCSGADVSARPAATAADQPGSNQNRILDQSGWVGEHARAIYHLDKPVIAAMNGIAAGGGLSTALACDMRVGSEHARFKTVFIERNLSPDSGTSWFLPRIIGYSRAMDLIMTSRDVGAEEAYRLGLLDRLVPHENLLAEATALAEQITRWPPIATRAGKRVVQQNMNVSLDDALRNEYVHIAYGRQAVNDQRESAESRLERRPPRFTGT